ncbi:MAG: non-heme iron oxygenase ferredoxin subunit [Candidatus Binatia bacterium]
MQDSDLVSLCQVAEVAVGSAKRVEPPGLSPLAVFNLGGAFFVTDDTCTHGLASLADGYVDGDQIECPWHNGRFCIRTGEPTGFPAVTAIRTYPVTVVGEEVCIRANGSPS